MMVPTLVQHALAQEAREVSTMFLNRHLGASQATGEIHKIYRRGSRPGLLNEHLQVQGPQEILS